MKIDSAAVRLEAASASKKTTVITSASIEMVARGDDARNIAVSDAAAMIQALKDSKGKYTGGVLANVTGIKGAVKDEHGAALNLSALNDTFQNSKKIANEKEMKEQQARGLSEMYRQPRTGRAKSRLFSNDRYDLQFDVLRQMLEALTGKKFKFDFFKPIQLDGEQNQGQLQYQSYSSEKTSETLTAVSSQQTAQTAPSAPVSAGQLYHTTINYASAESMIRQSYSFNASALVNTADGKQISVSLELNMSSEVYSKFEALSMKSVAFKDPLVINFGASSAELTDTKFRFDLDADGREDQISTLKSGSGFLALDTYGDGSVRDGKQLFGALSGNGFADLAAYDGDGNGWIDENDEIFDKLRIWSFGEDGKQTLAGLGEKGIGAIFLGNVSADYELYGDSANANVNGMIRSAGIFLREDGTAGTVQHVDLAV